jgi:hypothetical protein
MMQRWRLKASRNMCLSTTLGSRVKARRRFFQWFSTKTRNEPQRIYISSVAPLALAEASAGDRLLEVTDGVPPYTLGLDQPFVRRTYHGNGEAAIDTRN